MQILPFSVFQEYQPYLLSILKDLVAIESPSLDKASVDRLGQHILPLLKDLGGQIQVIPQASAGDQIIARWGAGPGGVLVLTHMDTVFDLGMLEKNPYREEDGRLYGPGILDMKCGIAMMLTILRIYQQQGIRPVRPLAILFSSDEEIGSQTSRKMIEELGSQSSLALCLEPALASGAIKTARKGTGDITLHIQGVPAHAGIDHARGRNAIEELAYHVIEAQKLTDYVRGTTVNVGVVHGGTRGNVVPGQAEALIDFRVTTLEEAERLRQWAASISSVIDGTVIAADFTINRPPMPRNELIGAAFDKARMIAQELGFSLQEGSTGGGSDANFVAPLGIPVLDGLGGVGDGAHSDREYVLVSSLVERTALVAALILNA